MVDQAAPYHFNEYLYERFETSDWKSPTTWHRVKTAKLKATSGPVASVMQVSAHPAGVEVLTQTVVLYHRSRGSTSSRHGQGSLGRRNTQSNAEPRGKEAVYVALPLAIAGPQIRHGCQAACRNRSKTFSRARTPRSTPCGTSAMLRRRSRGDPLGNG